MKKLYFINDWYAKQPWYIKSIGIVCVIAFFILQFYITKNYNNILFTVIFIALYGAFYGWLLFNNQVKNAFIYSSKNQFSIKIEGHKVDFQTKHINAISLTTNGSLQIQRINRVDTFDLSPFRKKDCEKLIDYLKELSADVESISSDPIIETN